MSSSTNRYDSIGGYRLDPSILQPTDSQETFDPKEFYGPVENDTQAQPFQPAQGEFDIQVIGQTPFEELIEIPPQSTDATLSLYTIANNIKNAVGSIWDQYRSEDQRCLGTCALIARNIVLCTRHSIQEYNMRELSFVFGFFNKSSDVLSSEGYIIEHCNFDYVLIVLKEQLKIDPLIISSEMPRSQYLGLLHYPDGEPMQISVQTWVNNNYQGKDFRIETYHDTSYSSSGGVYFDSTGLMVGMHLGSELELINMNLKRFAHPTWFFVNYSSPFKFLVSNPERINHYLSFNSFFKINTISFPYIIDEEGYQAKKIFIEEAKAKGVKNYPKTRKGELSTSKKSIETIKKDPNLNLILDSTKTKCMNKGLLYSECKSYSIKNILEADHLLPTNVWKNTKNVAMKTLFNRVGKGGLAAATIPKEKHRKLLTTGGVPGFQAFHKKLTDLCNQSKISDAVDLCLDQYKIQNVLTDCKKGTSEELDIYQDQGILTQKECDDLKNKYCA